MNCSTSKDQLLSISKSISPFSRGPKAPKLGAQNVHGHGESGTGMSSRSRLAFKVRDRSSC